jgi:predicted DNA-binding protein with PD1-like motif
MLPAQEAAMRSSLLLDRGERTFVLVFDKDDEVVEGLTRFASRERLRASHVSAIGALREVVLGYFDPATRDYRRIPLGEQVEVLSLLGVITLDGEKPKLHAHIVVGRADGTAHGGHLLEGRVWPTLEVVLEELPRHLQRRTDPETGLALIDLGDRARAA